MMLIFVVLVCLAPSTHNVPLLFLTNHYATLLLVLESANLAGLMLIVVLSLARTVKLMALASLVLPTLIAVPTRMVVRNPDSLLAILLVVFALTHSNAQTTLAVLVRLVIIVKETKPVLLALPTPTAETLMVVKCPANRSATLQLAFVIFVATMLTVLVPVETIVKLMEPA